MLAYLKQSEIQKIYKTTIVPRNTSRTGYGSKIATQYKIKINGRLHRVYCRIYSNAGTCYIIKNGVEWITSRIDEGLFEDAIVIDGRYLISLEYTGAVSPKYLVWYCNKDVLGYFETYEAAENAMTEHYNNRFNREVI